jgi:hypothetical protein
MTRAADFLGNALAGADREAVAAIDDFVGGFITYEQRAVKILEGATAHPDAQLANAYAAILWMLLEAPEAPARAAPFLARAEAATGDERSRRTTAFVRAWAGGDIDAALSISAAIVADWPTDLAMLKLHQYHALNRGDFPGLLRIALQAAPANDQVPQIHGMIAFGYEQCHLLAEAEAAARRALSMRANEPWAQHALAHVMLTQGRIDEGARFMEQASETWVDLNSFMYTHNWWHLALFYLSQGREAAVLDIYDRHCWGQEKAYSQDQIGAASLLARMEFADIDVGERWSELADHLEGRAEDVVQPFLSLQYLYGLARAGRPQAARLLAAIRARAEAAVGFEGEVWRDVALPAAEAITGFLGGEPTTAFRRMGAALPRLVELGGSHAQRDLFEQIHLQALLAAGRDTLAQQVLEQRRAFDPDGAPLNHQLAGVYARLGLPTLARAAQARARATRARFAA